MQEIRNIWVVYLSQTASTAARSIATKPDCAPVWDTVGFSGYFCVHRSDITNIEPAFGFGRVLRRIQPESLYGRMLIIFIRGPSA